MISVIVFECTLSYTRYPADAIFEADAVNPALLMGVTQRVAELLTQRMTGRGRTCIVAVHFGNVLGSRGTHRRAEEQGSWGANFKLQLLPGDILDRLDELPERVASLEGLMALWLFGSFEWYDIIFSMDKGSHRPGWRETAKQGENGCLMLWKQPQKRWPNIGPRRGVDGTGNGRNWCSERSEPGRWYGVPQCY